jgi:D-glycero-D-manno-heptose 1,7-bisphosphate phosphatase
LTGKGEQTKEKGGLPPGSQVHADLAAMVDAILASQPEHNVATHII